jgi:pyruvate formate lyase activating enzyme
MREAILYEKLKNNKIKCGVCPRECTVSDGKSGYCCVRANHEGSFYALTYGKITSAAADPIEKKPLFHFHPGTRVFSIGSAGCNLRCAHCQNWEIAHEKPGQNDLARMAGLPPEEAVAAALENGCAGIAWTYNEPTIWLEYTIDTAKLAQEAGLYTVYVTNGYATEEAVDAIGPHLGAYRVDVKGFTDELYVKLANARNWRTILAAAERAQKKWGCHVEIVTNVIPTMNDDEAQLKGIAEWIRDSLGAATPWHVTRFMPYLELSHLPPTPVATLERAREIGLAAGLKFVYIGNVPGHASENTYCPNCGAVTIERSGYETLLKGVADRCCCAACGEPLRLVT